MTPEGWQCTEYGGRIEAKARDGNDLDQEHRRQRSQLLAANAAAAGVDGVGGYFRFAVRAAPLS